jgi:hypothetical protein
MRVGHILTKCGKKKKRGRGPVLRSTPDEGVTPVVEALFKSYLDSKL